MGHVRLGRLPKTRRWHEVVATLGASGPESVPVVAGLVMRAASTEFTRLKGDPMLTYCFWLLTQACSAAGEKKLWSELADVGVEPAEVNNAFQFVVRLGELARLRGRKHPESGVFSEISAMSLTYALSKMVRYPGTLFGSATQDIESILRTQAGPSKFGSAATDFFSHFLSRTLLYLVNRELMNCVGENRAMANLAEASEFNRALTLYAHQSARILTDFAEGWLSKAVWEGGGHVSEADASRFVAVSLQKLVTGMIIERERYDRGSR